MTLACIRSTFTFSLRVGRVPGHQSWFRILRKSRVRAGDRTTARWLVVRTILYRHGRTGMGASDRCRPHGFRYRFEQRGFREGVLDGREHDDRWKHLGLSWTDWDRRIGPSESRPPSPDVFVLQIKRCVWSLIGFGALHIPKLILDDRGCVGLFAGLSLEGTVLVERKDANRDFYGSPVPARDILSGRVPPPEVASRLYEVIEAAEGIDESGVADTAYVPTATGDHIEVGAGRTVFDAEGHQ